MTDAIRAFESSRTRFGAVPKTLKLFQRIIYAYFRHHRRNLPWRRTSNPYRILVSEIMLQQTQVDRVTLKYREFIRTFPDFQALANAPLKKVLKTWQGLGYNRRALMLHRLSKAVVTEYGGVLPPDVASLEKLPGVGIATASAVMAFAFNKPAVFIETNIRTVYLHFFFPQARSVPDAELVPLIERTTDKKNPREWYWALMDYGSMLKKKYPNPSRRSAHHSRQSSFQGSNRQIRGRIIKYLLKKSATARQLSERIGIDVRRVQYNLGQLAKEGLVAKQGVGYQLS